MRNGETPSRKLPFVATVLLMRFGPQDDSLLGDIAEEYQAGRSRTWYWRQTLTAVALTAAGDLKAHPLRALSSVLIGWGSLLSCFALGDVTANSIAGLIWGWSRQAAYATGWWWPFQVTAAFISYAGFALSAAIVARSSRRSPAMVLVYAASVIAVLLGFAIWMETTAGRPVPMPHTLFFALSVALPYHWRSGVLLAPALIVAVGMLATPPREHHVPKAL